MMGHSSMLSDVFCHPENRIALLQALASTLSTTLFAVLGYSFLYCLNALFLS